MVIHTSPPRYSMAEDSSNTVVTRPRNIKDESSLLPTFKG